MRTRVGYAGGTHENPTYHDLGDHAESIQVDFDPAKTGFDALLEKVWESHNPCATTWSAQYRNLVFYADEAQRAAIEASKSRLEARLGKPVKTGILPLRKFWPAEDYHQKYALRGDEVLLQDLSRPYPKPVDLMNSTAAARVNGYVAGDGTKAQLEAEIGGLGLGAEGMRRLRAYVRR